MPSAQVGGHGSRVAQRVPRRLRVGNCDDDGRMGLGGFHNPSFPMNYHSLTQSHIILHIDRDEENYYLDWYISCKPRL